MKKFLVFAFVSAQIWPKTEARIISESFLLFSGMGEVVLMSEQSCANGRVLGSDFKTRPIMLSELSSTTRLETMHSKPKIWTIRIGFLFSGLRADSSHFFCRTRKREIRDVCVQASCRDFCFA